MAQQNPQQTDNSMAALWIIAGIFLVGLIIWYLFRVEIVAFILHLRVWELSVVGIFTNSFAGLQQEIATLAQNPANVSFAQLQYYSTQVGSIIRFPFIIILVVFAVMLYLGKATMRFKSTLTMQNLVDMEKINWLQITPVAKLDLVSQPLEKGKWAIAMTPMQFAKKHKLLAEEQEDGHFDPRVKRTATVLENKAREEFAMQLGREWHGVEALRPHTRALFVIFAARANGDRDVAEKMLTQIAASTAKGRLNFNGVDELLKKYSKSPAVKYITSRHAYELTVMASMLELARTDGVLATADFLWLKPLDRTLWFMLNTIGRQTSVTEVAGPFAHWKAEKELGRRLSVPMIDEAVNALTSAIAGVIYTPDEDTLEDNE